MRKWFAALCLIVVIVSAGSACSNSTKPEQTTKTESEIRTMVYQTLSEGEKESIPDWENAEVVEYTALLRTS